jgi:hypothetical protein
VGATDAGRVYLALSYDPWDEDVQPHWDGHREFDGGFEPGPSFADASDAVRWWRDRGAEWILIRIDDFEYLWAGVGPPPVDDDGPAQVFSDDDSRGRPEGARATAEAARSRLREDEAAERLQRAVEEGSRLRIRREAVGLTVADLAARVGHDPSWINDIESGRTALEVRFKEWVDLVWATQDPWPDARRTNGTGSRFGWVASEGEQLAVAEQLVRRHLDELQE